MKLTATLAAALAVALAGLAPLSSAHAGGWTGCYAGAHGGYAVGASEIAIGGVASLDGISSEGAEGGPLIGCDLQTTDRIVFGAFADYAFRSVDTKLTLGGASAFVGLEDAWSVGVRAGWLVSPQTLVYGLAVYQHTDFDDAGSGLISDLSGFGGGAGIETEILPGLALRGEYRYVAYDDESIAGVATLDTDEHQVRAGLVWRFVSF